MISLRKDAATGNKHKMYYQGKEVKQEQWGKYFQAAQNDYEGRLKAAQQIITELNYENAKLEADTEELRLDNELNNTMLKISEAKYKRLIERLVERVK